MTALSWRAFVISRARLFAATHVARCANALAQGEAFKPASFVLDSSSGAAKGFCSSFAVAQKENRETFAAQTNNKATIAVRGNNALQVFRDTECFLVKLSHLKLMLGAGLLRD
jgi:hypothetical protein